ncbi:MAG: hypothetical protein L0K86_09945, partial [Actinomycetia bacterium]|nr:hypothetical protein [Actinomycetes bacterium]
TASRLIRADHDLLLGYVDDVAESELKEAYRTHDGPLGHFCDSRHDLVAHVLMWSEISLGVLHEARSGRKHWSIEPRWETAEIGSALNKAGVQAGRELPSQLLVERVRWVRDAFDAELASIPGTEWDGANGVGATLYEAMTPPGSAPYAHAALHLFGTS